MIPHPEISKYRQEPLGAQVGFPSYEASEWQVGVPNRSLSVTKPILFTMIPRPDIPKCRYRKSSPSLRSPSMAVQNDPTP